MAWSPRKKALAFAGALLLISVVLVGTSVATTGSALRPLLGQEQYGQERGLARGHHSALAVRVAQIVDGEPVPVDGATVAVARMGADRSALQPVATKTTGARGAAVFELKPGAYQIVVTKGALTSQHAVRLNEGLLVSVVFDEDGNAHWSQRGHREMERRGESAGLVVRVFKNDSGRIVPVQGARVEVHRIRDNATEFVANMTTGPRGAAAFQLIKGPYLVKVSAGDVDGEHRLRLTSPKVVGAMVHGDEMRFREGDQQAAPQRTARR